MSSLSYSNSLIRVRSLQRLLASLELDALLCIPGVDSNYNEGSRRLFNYLLYQLSGAELDQLELGASSEEEEDTFLLISPTGVSVYCHPNLYDVVISRLGRWHPSLSVFCDLSYPDREDTDHFEVFKIQSFIEMTQNVKHIGVPYGRGSTITTRSEDQGFSQMSVEQWPLIQAYALEELGGCGFFTMTHRISDVSCEVERVYSEVDPLSATYLYKRGEKIFSKQWDDLIDSISRLDPEDIGDLSELELLAGMKTYIQHAKRLEQNPGRSKGYAYVLIGPNSQKLKYKPCPVASNSATIRSAEGVNHNCVVELSDPLLPLASARTLFFSQPHSPFPPPPALSPPRAANPELEYLVRLYRLLVTEVRNGMLLVLSAAKLGDVREAVLERIRAGVNKEGEGGDRHIGVDVHMHSYNLFKEDPPIESELNNQSVYYLKATLTDIMSPLSPAKKLGAIVFGDSFLTNKLRVETCERQLTTDTRESVTVLTECVPVFLSWADKCSQLLEGVTLKSRLQSGEESLLGNPISLAVKDISLSTDFIPSFTPPVKTYFLSRGLVLQNSAWKFVWLPWDQIERIRLIERTGSEEEKRLQFSLKSSLLSHLPLFLRSERFSLHYPPHCTEHSKLYTEIIAYLKSVRPAEDNYFAIESTALDSKEIEMADSVCYGIEKFSELNQLSCAYDGLITSQTLSCYYPDTAPSIQDRIVVTVIGGLPGCNVDMLSSLIIETTRGECEWIVVREQVERDYLFNAKQFHEYFQEVVERCLKKRQEQSEIECRILVVAPCFSAPSQLVQGILLHPTPAVRERTCVGSVTLCLNPGSAFKRSGELHPLISHILRPGVISNIIISGATPQTQTDQSPLSTLQYNQLLALCRSLAVGADVIQTPLISSLSPEYVMTLLSSDNFSKLGRVRCWYNPYLDKESRVLVPIHVDSRTIRCRSYLCQASLNAALKTLPSEVEFVKGVVNFTSDTSHYHHVEMNHSSVQFYPSSCSKHPPDTSMIVFYGSDLQQLDLVSVVKSSLPQEKQKLSFKTEENLSKEELDEIDIRCKGVSVPEGVYFNGYQYVGFDGERWTCHPCRPEIVSEYLVEKNKKIESHNTDIDKFYEEIFSF